MHTGKYTILTTFPGERSSSNVGDQLIEIALKQLLQHELGPVEFLTVFREDSLEDILDEVNATEAILMPGFGLRDAVPVFPVSYRLMKNWTAGSADISASRTLLTKPMRR